MAGDDFQALIWDLSSMGQNNVVSVFFFFLSNKGIFVTLHTQNDVILGFPSKNLEYGHAVKEGFYSIQYGTATYARYKLIKW
jgi:hypothetical protein